MATPDPSPSPSSGALNPFEIVIDGVQDIGNAIGGTADFLSDPFGAMYDGARNAVNGLATDLLPALTGATLPDLTLDAFLDTYRVSFALAMFVAVVLLIVQLVRTGRGTQSGRDTLHAIGLYFPAFLLGVMFGPAAGIVIVNFVRALTESIVAWAYAGTAAELAGSLTGVLQEDPAAFAGGVYIAFLVAWAMAIGMLFIVLLFVIQLVTLYFSGVLIPLAAVWIIDPTRRSVGLRAVGVWVGILMTHPLLFLLLGFAFRLIGGTISSWGSDGWKNLISLLIAVLALYMAALSPFFILKYVKSISDGGGASVGAPSGPAIGDRSPGRRAVDVARPQPVAASPVSAPAQTVRNSAAPSGPTLSQAAATRATAPAGGGGQVVTAGAGSATRAGMGTRAAAGVGVAAAATAARKGYEETKKAADTSVTPPPRESYGKDRP